MEININENEEKGKWYGLNRVFWPVFIVLAGIGVYGAVTLVGVEKGKVGVVVESPQVPSLSSGPPLPKKGGEADINLSAAADTPLKVRGVPSPRGGVIQGLYEAARGGTVYYLPTCSGAKKIAEKNKIWFDSKAEAEKFGYKPAKNCKGL